MNNTLINIHYLLNISPKMVEDDGVEPTASCVQGRRSTN